MASPRSVRLSDDVLRRLSDLATRRDVSVSSVIERLLDEAVRREAHPAITFRDGPSGRRAGLAGGPDIDEVIRTLRDVHTEGSDSAVAAVAASMSITPDAVRAAVAYYADHSAEIDHRVTANQRLADELESTWRRQQQIVAGPAR